MRKYLGILLLIFLITSGLEAQVGHSGFESDLQRFHAEDSLTPPGDNIILFIGSSSFTMWKDLNEYFPGYPVLNRAYGGSCLTDLINDFDRLVLPYHPRQVMIYCGENDFATDTTLAPEEVVYRFKQLFTMLRDAFPAARITYVSMKPSPSRWNLREKYIIGNNEIRKFLKKQKNCSFVNVWSLMLDKDGNPKSGIFIEDNLHMNASGYRIWQKAIKRHLLK